MLHRPDKTLDYEGINPISAPFFDQDHANHTGRRAPSGICGWHNVVLETYGECAKTVERLYQRVNAIV
jgi:hypothetical protein